MDGSYRGDDLPQKVGDWIRLVLQTRHDPPIPKPLTIHLDQLLGKPVAREHLVTMSFGAFLELIRQMEALGIPDSFMPSLYVPLECAETLEAGSVSRDTLLGEINYNEPPSLYLTERSLQTRLWPMEQYVFPLQASDFVDNPEGIYVYYNATRSLEDIKNGWEYGRNVTAEYYPSAYRLRP